MCILIDDREDHALTERLEQFGIPLSTVRLEFGDIAIQSSGGEVLVGFERKKLTDLIASMQDRRLSGHQLRGMRGLYDRVELIVEGLWRPGDGGAIEVPQHGHWEPLYFKGSGISYRQVDSFLYSQTDLLGVRVWRTSSTAETAHLLASRWHWWQKDYELHKSHEALYSNDPAQQHRGAVLIHNGPANLVTLMAAQIPGIDAKAWDVGKHFRSPLQMCEASAPQWRRVEWVDRKGKVKHFGREAALKLTKILQGG